MSAPFQINVQRRNEFLSEAVTRKTQISLSVTNDVVWHTYKSRFLGCEKDADSDEDNLVIEYPMPKDQAIPEITPLQNIGLSFRRGHKKCLFDTVVLKRLDWRLSKTASTQALVIATPTSMFELQRRMFHRISVPDHMTLDVKAWPITAEDDPSMVDIFNGPMLDLSAGGVSFIVPTNSGPTWATNTTVLCDFPSIHDNETIEAPAQFRYCEKLDDQYSRVGLQFAGLEASVAGRATLQRILEMTAKLNRM